MKPFRVTLAVGMIAASAASCGTSSSPKDRVVGTWAATDGTEVAIRFDRDGKLRVGQKGNLTGDPGDYKFVDDRTVEVTGKNFLITVNTRPVPMSFHVDFENGGKDIVVSPTPTRPSQMQFSMYSNGKVHVFPPEKKPARYTRVD